MKKIVGVIFLLLLGAGAIRADPIDVATLPPRPEILLALIAEVLAVTAIVGWARVRLGRFMAVWYAVNLLTFYLLLPAVGQLTSNLLVGELAVVAVEAVALYAVTRIGAFRSPATPSVSWIRVIVASVAGNLTSILAAMVIFRVE